ncbi:hypothetical protein BJX66DRAFT_319346 [Aspergillus keveii]|uniref:Uncharacterized protein n=1 Tax=Aspergillus keveii TaxID=714993 RepID=A0ABR4FIC8_9EURO
MCFNISLDGIRRKCGYNEDDIYEAKLRWANLKIRHLPEAYYETSQIQIDWHSSQLRKAHAVLQLMKQLSQENGAEIYIYNLHPDICLRATAASSKGSVKVAYTDQDRRNDFRRLHAEFLNIQRSITTGSSSGDAVIWKYNHYWRHDHYNRDGPSRLWESASKGGCCVRDRGCCERVLYEYPLRDWGNEDTMYMRKVYAHCTTECGCCVITHGVYVPDKRLPSPAFISKYTSQ